MNKTQFVIEPNSHRIEAVREFNGTPEQVFFIMTNPDYVSRWWGPRELETRVEVLDAKNGGRWRFLQKAPDGNEYGFHGTYHEVAAPSRIVQTTEFEGMPGHVSLEFSLLEPTDAGCRLRAITVYETIEDRDAAAAYGLEEGANDSYDRIDELVGSL